MKSPIVGTGTAPCIHELSAPTLLTERADREWRALESAASLVSRSAARRRSIKHSVTGAVVAKLLASPSASTYVVRGLERAEERSRCKPGEESPNTAGRDAA
jgi:hypothetical protein